MKLPKARGILLSLLAALALSLLLAALLDSILLGLLSAALLTAFIACAFSLWRCPHCGQLLGWNLAWSMGRGISFCPYCRQRPDK